MLAIDTITEINLTMFKENDLPECPTDEEIRSAIVSHDHGELFIRIRGHVRECRSCRSRLTQLGVWTQAETRFAPLISGEIPRPVLPATDHAQKSSGTPNRSEDFDFLAPAEAPGELGRLGGYRIIDVLGAGGMGVVFKGQDPSLARYVAIKVMKPVLTAHPFAKSRFLREARAAASINHENVIHIYQVGEDRGMPFLAMELLFGESIANRLKRDGPFPLSEVLRIGRGIAAGLAAAHRRNVVHRDIKPANIILEPVDDPSTSPPPSGHTTDPMLPIADCETINILHPSIETRVKIVDFGLARALDDDTELTQSGVIAGTPKYMSPEQAEGHELDSRTDLFSLGAVLFHMLTGEGPFQGRSSSAILVAVVTQSHRPLRDVDPTIPEVVDQFFSKLLAKKADDRYRTAAEVLDAITKLEREISSKSPSVTHGSDQVVPASVTTKTPGHSVRRPSVPRQLNRIAVFLPLVILACFVGLLFWMRIPSVVDRSNHDDNQFVPAEDEERTLLIADKTNATNVNDSQVEQSKPVEGSLSDWLKGREIITVSKSGNAQFHSIGEALRSVKNGQVVEVLDQGPYYENLIVDQPARDIGLISRIGTQISGPLVERREHRTVHDFWDVDRLRISGFNFIESEATKFDEGHIFMLTGIGDMTIENCVFLAGTPQSETHRKFIFHATTVNESSFLTVQDCWFGGRICCSGNASDSLIRRNFFDEYPAHQLVLINTGSNAGLSVSENVFLGSTWWGVQSASMRALSFVQNSFLGVGVIDIVDLIPPTSVDFSHNVVRGRVELLHAQNPKEEFEKFNHTWKCEGNIYCRNLNSSNTFMLPSDKDYLLSEEVFAIDLDRGSLNCGRVTKIPDEVARSVQIAGALPFSSRSENGDWFTALRDRKLKAQQFANESEESLRRASREDRLAAVRLVAARGGVVAVVEGGEKKQIANVDAIPRGDFKIKRISLGWNRSITDADLELFSRLNELQELDLNNTSITNAGLRHLEKLKSLEVLFLHGTKVTDAGVESLNRILSLRRLHLEATAITDRGIENLRPSGTLFGLYLGQFGSQRCE